VVVGVLLVVAAHYTSWMMAKAVELWLKWQPRPAFWDGEAGDWRDLNADIVLQYDEILGVCHVPASAATELMDVLPRQLEQMNCLANGILQMFLEIEVNANAATLLARQTGLLAAGGLKHLYDIGHENAREERRKAMLHHFLMRFLASVLRYFLDFIGVALVSTGAFCSDACRSFPKAIGSIPRSAWSVMAAAFCSGTVLSAARLVQENTVATAAQRSDELAAQQAAQYDQAFLDAAEAISATGAAYKAVAAAEVRAVARAVTEAAIRAAIRAAAISNAAPASSRNPDPPAPLHPAGDVPSAGSANAAGGSIPGPSAGAEPSKAPASSLDIEMGGRD